MRSADARYRFRNLSYVTSSSPSTGGVCTGAGVPPTALQNLIEFLRLTLPELVSHFPTELDNELGETIRKIGHEYGATTGRL